MAELEQTGRLLRDHGGGGEFSDQRGQLTKEVTGPEQSEASGQVALQQHLHLTHRYHVKGGGGLTLTYDHLTWLEPGPLILTAQ